LVGTPAVRTDERVDVARDSDHLIVEAESRELGVDGVEQR